MKHVLLTMALCSALSTYAQQPGELLDRISPAMESGNAQAVATYFRDEVMLNIPDEKGTFSPTKARQKLASFFRINQPSDFNILHQGTSQNNAQYIIGKLKSDKREFRTYLLIEGKANNQKLRIRELRFE